MKWFARARRSLFRRLASITTIFRKRLTKKCAIYSRRPPSPEMVALLRRCFGIRRNLWRWRILVRAPSPRSAMMLLHPMLTAFFHLLEPLLLFRRQICRDLAVRFRQHIANVFAGVPADFFELRAGLVDDWADLGHLFVG